MLGGDINYTAIILSLRERVTDKQVLDFCQKRHMSS